MSRPLFRAPLFSLATLLHLLWMPLPLAHAETAGHGIAVEASVGNTGFPWSVVMLLAAFLLTAFVGRGRNRGEA